MAAGTCVRICLHFSDLDDETCWFLVDFKKMPSIESIQRAIGRKFYNKEEKPFKLTLKGSLLPAWESSCILRDDDQIIVKPETAANPSSIYWCKKRKRKKRNLINSPKNYSFPLTKSKSLESTQTKNPESLLNKELLLTPETSPDNVGTPDNIGTPEIEDQKSCKKKKKKKLDCANEVPIEIEEIPAPKKAKISKSPKLERKFKKKAVTQKATPEVVEIINHPKTIVPLEPDSNQLNKVTISNKSGASQDLKVNIPELIKLDDDIPVNSNDTIPMEVSHTPPLLSDSKEVSMKIEDNSSEENANLVSLTDKTEISLTNLESNTKLGTSDRKKTSDLEKTYLQQDCSSSIDEHVEVYKIEKDDLDAICQSLKVGDTLTIDSDKVKVIDVENASNSSWFESVDVNNDETKTDETSTSKQNKKSSGNSIRRRRRRRGQRSFACSPFIFAMNQSIDSDADNKSAMSTPVASKPKKSVSSNNSQKHFYFESDGEDDDDDKIMAAKNISEFEMFVDEESRNNLQSSKSTLSSDKNVTNGAEDSNSSTVSQETGGGGEEKEDKSFSSQKSPSKKSDVLCESFDTNKGPIIYKRGQNPVQRRNYPTLIRQQQLNTSFENRSSISKSGEDDSDVTPVNCSTTTPKPTKEYSLLPGIVGYPRVGDKIAFKRLEIGEDYSPRLSDFIEAKVISFQEDTKMLEMKILSAPKTRKTDKFELIYKDDKDIMILEEPDGMESVELCTLQEMKLLK